MARDEQKPFRLISPTTKMFWREGQKIPGYSLFDFLHGYVYGRWPYLYIGIGTGNHPLTPLFRTILKVWHWLFPEQKTNGTPSHAINKESGTIADGYHGKVMPLSKAKQLVSVNEPINVQDLEQVIPYTRARAIIQNSPQKMVALECPCRAVRPDPCLPLDVCLIIGEPFASFVHDHHPARSRWIAQDEALQILEEENQRGHVHHAFFKDAMLGRFYAICNCCSCCCGAMNAQRNQVPMLSASGYAAQIDEESCIQCGTCQTFCQFDALVEAEDGHTKLLFDRCMGCGVCIDKCPQEAITLVKDQRKGIPLEIPALMEQAISKH